ncbi:hypothetical protein NFI96_005689 [Prochilodus magdalenae]|nr:hypothetical protein NFI96_005689 [Prochilodus magdalenae]
MYSVLCATINGEASLFEVNIRYVGGLLSAYYLTGEEPRPFSFLEDVFLRVSPHNLADNLLGLLGRRTSLQGRVSNV